MTDHSKVMANTKAFCRQTDRDTDKQTDGPKPYVPNLSMQGHKKVESYVKQEHTCVGKLLPILALTLSLLMTQEALVDSEDQDLDCTEHAV